MTVALAPPSAVHPLAEPEPLLADLRAVLPALEAAAAGADEAAAVAPATWAMLRQAGLLVAPLPAREGGVGLAEPERVDTLVTVLRLLGGADLSLARLYEGHVNALGLVARYGSPAQRGELAAAVRAGALSAVWGADGAAPLAAEPGRAGVALRGGKVLASGAGFIRRPLATAATPDGPLLLMLDLAPGERADPSGWTAQGMRSTATGTVDLDGLVLPAEAVIGQPGDFLRQPTLSGGAWRFCAAQLGAAERLLDLFRAALSARGRGGDPYQLARVASCAAATGSAAFWVTEAARRLAGADARDPAEVVAFANLTRMVTERAALDVIEAVHRGAGLGSFLRPSPIERVARDLATYLRQPVPDLAMADAARWLLREDRPVAELLGGTA